MSMEEDDQTYMPGLSIPHTEDDPLSEFVRIELDYVYLT